MRLKIPLSFAVALLLAGNLETRAQVLPAMAGVADTGMVTLGPNQKLRLTVVSRDTSGPATVRFRRSAYAEGVCEAGVCSHPVTAQSSSAPTVLTLGEALSTEIEGNEFGVRCQVLSSTARVRVVAEVIDGTSNTLSIIAILIG